MINNQLIDVAIYVIVIFMQQNRPNFNILFADFYQKFCFLGHSLTKSYLKMIIYGLLLKAI